MLKACLAMAPLGSLAAGKVVAKNGRPLPPARVAAAQARQCGVVDASTSVDARNRRVRSLARAIFAPAQARPCARTLTEVSHRNSCRWHGREHSVEQEVPAVGSESLDLVKPRVVWRDFRGQAQCEAWHCKHAQRKANALVVVHEGAFRLGHACERVRKPTCGLGARHTKSEDVGLGAAVGEH